MHEPCQNYLTSPTNPAPTKSSSKSNTSDPRPGRRAESPKFNEKWQCRSSVESDSHVRRWRRLPTARGELSDAVLTILRAKPGSLTAMPAAAQVDALDDDDFHLALYLCYELHYSAIADPLWEWDPQLLTFRAGLEKCFTSRLREENPLPIEWKREGPQATTTHLSELLSAPGGPSLSQYLSRLGTIEQLREFCIHRSAYQLKEADPHTFAIPRLSGPAKAAMLQIQYDEYGSGDPSLMHSTLFAQTMRELGLDDHYGAYVDVIPGVTLATVNLVSMFALHRRFRGALVGHLAVFEMTSVEPMGRYSDALRRLGVGADGRRFYDVHVVADAEHGVIARDRLVAGVISAEPELASDVLFGARCVMSLESDFSRHLLTQWSSGQSSLLSVLD
jgi:hypothetical protein